MVPAVPLPRQRARRMSRRALLERCRHRRPFRVSGRGKLQTKLLGVVRTGRGLVRVEDAAAPPSGALPAPGPLTPG
jgi:hypothetical protein